MTRKFTLTAATVVMAFLVVVSAATAGGPPTAQGLRADGLRWQAMADYYGRLQGLKADGLRWQAMARAYQAAPVTHTSAASSFDWSAAGIGAAVGFAVLLGAGGALVFVRRGRRTKLAL